LWNAPFGTRVNEESSDRVAVSALVSNGITVQHFTSKRFTGRLLSTSAAVTRSSASETDDDIDAALDNILEDVMMEAERGTDVSGHHKIPRILIEVRFVSSQILVTEQRTNEGKPMDDDTFFYGF